MQIIDDYIRVLFKDDDSISQEECVIKDFIIETYSNKGRTYFNLNHKPCVACIQKAIIEVGIKVGLKRIHITPGVLKRTFEAAVYKHMAETKRIYQRPHPPIPAIKTR